MERIGIAASKIAKGNLFLYNLYVVVIAFLFSLFVFSLAGSTVIFVVVVMRYVGQELMLVNVDRHWSIVSMVCMVVLTLVMVVFYLLALSKNLKFKEKSINQE